MFISYNTKQALIHIKKQGPTYIRVWTAKNVLPCDIIIIPILDKIMERHKHAH